MNSPLITRLLVLLSCVVLSHICFVDGCDLNACISCQSNIANSAGQCNGDDHSFIWSILQSKFSQAYSDVGLEPPSDWSAAQNRRMLSNVDRSDAAAQGLLRGAGVLGIHNEEEEEDRRDLASPTCASLCSVYGSKYCGKFGCYTNNRRLVNHELKTTTKEDAEKDDSNNKAAAVNEERQLCESWSATELQSYLNNAAYSGYNEAYHSGQLSSSCQSVIYNFNCVISVYEV